jgi:hypothetical protein
MAKKSKKIRFCGRSWRNRMWEWEVDETGSELCPTANSDINSVITFGICKNNWCTFSNSQLFRTEQQADLLYFSILWFILQLSRQYFKLCSVDFRVTDDRWIGKDMQGAAVPLSRCYPGICPHGLKIPRGKSGFPPENRTWHLSNSSYERYPYFDLISPL